MVVHAFALCYAPGMRALALLLLLLSAPAWADDLYSYTVTTDATSVWSSTNTRRHVLVVSRSGTIYCSPESNVTVNTGVPVLQDSPQSFPSVPIWCIAGSAQTGSGTSRTLVWESDA